LAWPLPKGGNLYRVPPSRGAHAILSIDQPKQSVLDSVSRDDHGHTTVRNCGYRCAATADLLALIALIAMLAMLAMLALLDLLALLALFGGWVGGVA
jgi:hypothetical protein